MAIEITELQQAIWAAEFFLQDEESWEAIGRDFAIAAYRMAGRQKSNDIDVLNADLAWARNRSDECRNDNNRVGALRCLAEWFDTLVERRHPPAGMEFDEAAWAYMTWQRERANERMQESLRRLMRALRGK